MKDSLRQPKGAFKLPSIRAEQARQKLCSNRLIDIADLQEIERSIGITRPFFWLLKRRYSPRPSVLFYEAFQRRLHFFTPFLELRFIGVSTPLLLSLLFFMPKSATAQWNLVAPGLLGAQSNQSGAITTQSGIVWAGSTTLWMSPDNGLTWSKRSPVLFSNDAIRDINFYDALTGLVATGNGSIYRTDDQGLTWKEIHRSPSCSSVTFTGSPSFIMLTSGGGGTVEYSMDGGATWGSTGLDLFDAAAVHTFGGSAMALAGSISGASLFQTNDRGQTWKRMPGKVDLDSYSFGVDHCDDSLIYVVNEEGTTVSNGFAEIFVSTDQGATWSSNAQMPRRFYSGSVSVASNAVYCQTTANGIVRSADAGKTWKSIGGPSAMFDTRLVCALDDNLVIAADDAGSIWRTTNSGGDTVHGIVRFSSLQITPHELFATDSLLRCDSPVVRSVVLDARFCNVPSVLAQQFSGPDSLDYQLRKPLPNSLTGHDTISVSFLPMKPGSQQGSLNITLEDGTVITIPLHGFGKPTHLVTMTTLDASTDTIGGSLRVPIIIRGDSALPGVDCVLRYDTTVLIYHGSFTKDGVPLDKPGTRWLGHSGIHADSAALSRDSVIGYATFEGFPIDTACTKVRFDSLSVIAPLTPCAFDPYGDAVATLCFPRGCGVVAISKFMRYRQMPDVKVFPNPASGNFSLLATEDLSAQTELIDLLGRTLFSGQIVMHGGEPEVINAARFPRGRYYLRMQNETSVRTFSIVLR